MVSLQRTFVLTGVGSAYAYILQLAIQHVEEVCLRVLTLSCQMLISMAGLIEGIFAFVFSFYSHLLFQFHIFVYQFIIFLLCSSFIISILLKRIMNPQALNILVQ